MGIHGIYKEIGSGQRIALSKLAVEKFEETGRPLRIAIDVSIWLFQIQAGKGGTNPAPRTFYYRLLRLIALCIHPIFVFDGPNKPPFKRGKKTGGHVSSVPDFLAKQLIKQFGFPIHYAPGEAEAECALLQREGIVDAVLSEDVDTLMFGSGLTIRNWSPEPGTSGKTPTHVNVYDAAKTRASGLDPEGMILVALMSGGDYVPKGIPNCGPKTACEAARAGFGRDLCRLKKSDQAGIRAWRERLQHELKTNESKFFATKHGVIKIPDDFPRFDILTYYTSPVVSNNASLENLRRSMSWDKDIDFPGLRTFAHDAFDWIKLEGAKHFIRCLAPAMLVRGLRMRAMGDRFIAEDPEAIREDEYMLVKGIHNRRQHPITDNATELRVSYTPIELVKIDLSQEEPDDFPCTNAGIEGPESADADLDTLEFEDDEDSTAARKRGPTKFDPSKPARVWVLETYVKVGVPLTAQDWEASQRLPKRAAPSKETRKSGSKAQAGNKTRTTRSKKATDATPQTSIMQFGGITKPTSKRLQPVSKPRGPSSRPLNSCQALPQSDFIDLLSPSPPKPTSTTPLQRPKERSLSPVRDLPSSVTRRRKRGPLARSHTSPANLGSPLARPTTPPPDIIHTLNLVTSPTVPSPSELPTKKARTRSVRDIPQSGVGRQKTVAVSPSKTKQTTLDTWARSSPVCTPTKARSTNMLAASGAPIPAPPQFQKALDSSIPTLDLTASSPPKPISRPRPGTTATANPAIPTTTEGTQGTHRNLSDARPPLQSLCSNSPFSPTTSSVSHASTSTRPPITDNPSKPKAGRKPCRISPRLSKSSSTTIHTLDLTLDSSPPPEQVRSSLSNPARSVQPAASTFDVNPTFPSPPPRRRRGGSGEENGSAIRRSPRLRPSPPTAAAGPASGMLSSAQAPTDLTTPSSGSAFPPPPQNEAAWKRHRAAQTRRKRVIKLRASGIGTWEFGSDECTSPAGNGDSAEGVGGGKEVMTRNGKERRCWRESQVGVLNLVGDD